MLYIIGIGLNKKGISLEGLEACKDSETYLESYTVDFPYYIKDIEKFIGKEVKKLEREDVESDKLINLAKKKNIALLVYGAPLSATTHNVLIEDCEKNSVKCKVIYSGSIFDAVAETGLSLYKFGKVASMPKFTENYKPTSFVDLVKENQSIKAHSLILVDIGLDFPSALKQLKESLEFERIVVCSKMGTEEQKIFYGSLNSLEEKDFEKPFCFIIPSELNFKEKDFLQKFK